MVLQDRKFGSSIALVDCHVHFTVTIDFFCFLATAGAHAGDFLVEHAEFYNQLLFIFILTEQGTLQAILFKQA